MVVLLLHLGVLYQASDCWGVCQLHGGGGGAVVTVASRNLSPTFFFVVPGQAWYFQASRKGMFDDAKTVLGFRQTLMEVCSPFEAKSSLKIQKEAASHPGTEACTCDIGAETIATTCYKRGALQGQPVSSDGLVVPLSQTRNRETLIVTE